MKFMPDSSLRTDFTEERIKWLKKYGDVFVKEEEWWRIG